MDIVEKIVEWSDSQPLWHRVVISEILNGKTFIDDDILRFTQIALQEVTDPEGLISKYGNPLEKFEYSFDEVSDSVSVGKVYDTLNVNDISDGSELPFELNGLNIVYGSNGAGKSGYTRILKSSCMARHEETVHGSIYREDSTETSAKIMYKVGDEQEVYQWSNSSSVNPSLKTVNVFDSKSGNSYLTKHTDIKYKPAGMDVLDKLVDIIRKVSDKLGDEKRSKTLQLTDLSPIFIGFEGTKAFELISSLDKRGAVEELNKWGVLSQEELSEITTLETEIPEKERHSPAKYRENLTRVTLRLERIAQFGANLASSIANDCQKAIDEALKLKKEADLIAETAKQNRFNDDKFLKGTGDDLWKVMWGAARQFSEQSAYPSHEHPFVGDDAKCVLCQQPLNEEAITRQQSFSKYVLDKSQENATGRRKEYEKLVEAFIEIRISDDDIDTLFSDVSSDDYSSIDLVHDAIGSLTAFHDKYAKALAAGHVIVEDIDVSQELASIHGLREHIEKARLELEKPLDDKKYSESIELEKRKLLGLKARKLLLENDKAIRTNINTYISLAANSAALGKCNTQAISLQSGRLSNDYILAPLKDTFNIELEKIFSSKLKAELISAPTRLGIPHSEIVLSADGTRSREKIEAIMSEGEQRGLALAGFFTELSMMPHLSSIIFDDPITSMDDDNANKIAKRLVEAAKERQVIVFTHRVTFVSQLIEESKIQGVTKVPTKTISKLSQPGIVEDRMPWEAMSVGDRIKWLNNNLQTVLTPLVRDGHAETYQLQGELFYKKMRETWERAVEERLFGDVVKRHSRNISTQQLGQVKYLPTDNEVVGRNMTRCSKFVHDSGQESVESVPTLEILSDDLNVLKSWLEELKQRTL